MKTITREILFCCIVLPLCVLYIITQVSAGLLIPSSRCWYDAVDIIKRISLHLRCAYYQCLVPWNKERVRKIHLNDWSHLTPALEVIATHKRSRTNSLGPS